jgi:predicted membrane protein (TIGR00267 family)
MFDATFTLLGVVSGSAFVSNPDIRLIILTLVSSSVALGISSSVSVYEAESLEGERSIEELEKAMLTELENTIHTQAVGRNALLASIVMFATPQFSCLITLTPFILAKAGLLEVGLAGWVSIGLSLCTLTLVGTIMGNNGKRNTFLKGIRMAFFGALAFLIGYFLELLI